MGVNRYVIGGDGRLTQEYPNDDS